MNGAFMDGPLPEHHLLVLKPPRAFVEAGLAQPDECWTLRRAVYGLRISPKAWGLERDAKLLALSGAAYGATHSQFISVSWTADDARYHLEQCTSDSQVWMIKKVGETDLLGLVVVHVDDFLITSPLGPMRDGLKEALKSIWNLSDEQVQAPDSPLRFLGLEMERTKTGIKVHQCTFYQ